MVNSGLLISTDLDGTLLNHHDYHWTAARPLLQRLAQQGVVVVLNSSKTFAELAAFSYPPPFERRWPFICENGAAIALPDTPDYAELLTDELPRLQGYALLELSGPRQQWLSRLQQLPAELQHSFTPWSRLEVAAIAAATGLSLAEAELASQRRYSEPLCWHGSDSDYQALRQRLEESGAVVTRGGRFVHIGDRCDKGRALQRLSDLLLPLSPTSSWRTLALGDSENDRPMLEQAEAAAVVINPPKPALVLNRACYTTRQPAPMGWIEAVEWWLS
ncbi:HAD-IIB family hydrolase [Ectothiorhodospiraceae bacterium BW-2]|nr:HAD-IIB family hydrolase [Ectothiorhodospiraceae bacterium BW-2]